MIYLILTGILLFYAAYMFLNIGAALFYKKPASTKTDNKHSFLLFYPAYKPDESLIQNIRHMKAELAEFNAKIYVLSQEAPPEINAELQSLADYFDDRSFRSAEGNAYHRALQFAVGRISQFSTGQEKIESILLMDPDNYTHASSISRLIQGRISGADVVLSRRKAAGSKQASGLFDGMSERINDYMMRRSKQVLGLTPELSGSGMMMQRQLFEQAVHKLDRKAPGMDKQLLINMMFIKDDLNILFDEEALIFDEKTEDNAAFNRQRQRWFGNQYYNARVFGWSLITSGKLSMIDYALALYRPPRSIQIVLSVLLSPFDVLLYLNGWIPFPLVAISALILMLSLTLFFISDKKGRQVISQFLSLSQLSLMNGYTAFKSLMPGNSGTFIHTRN
jgi:hypothetical protein